MSDRMVSCVRLFAFRKDISMNNKDRKRQIAYEVLMILGSLALLTFICRLWPILLLIILGIFVAAIRLLFLSGNRVDPVEPQPLLPAPISAPTESDLRKLAHSLITNRVTTLVLNEYPNARWIWEAPNAFELIELGEEVYMPERQPSSYTTFVKALRSLLWYTVTRPITMMGKIRLSFTLMPSSTVLTMMISTG